MIASFCPEGLPGRAPPRSRFPVALPPLRGVFRQRRRVEWPDIDSMQHVNNSVYLAYIEDCELQAATAYGWSRARMWAEGLVIVARQHRLEYRLPAVLDDELEITTWVSAAEGDTATRHYTITRMNDGLLLVRALTLWETVDVKTRHPQRISEALLADMAPQIMNT